MLVSPITSSPMLTSSRRVASAHKSLPPGATIRKIAGDGNCLFRALSLSLFGTQDQHTLLRSQIVANVVQNWSHYCSYIIGDNSYGHPIDSANDYKNHMSKNGAEGGHLELNVATRIYNISIRIYNSKNSKVIVLGHSKLHDKKEIDLLYTGEGDKGHYDAVLIDGKKYAKTLGEVCLNGSIKDVAQELNNNILLNGDGDDTDDENISVDLEEPDLDCAGSSFLSYKFGEKSEEDPSNSGVSSVSSRVTRQSLKLDSVSNKKASNTSDMVKKSHKKSNDTSLHMECLEEELSTTQLSVIKKAETNYKEAVSVLSALVAKFDGEVIEKGEISLVQLHSYLTKPPPPPPSPPIHHPVQNLSPVSPSPPLVNVRSSAVLQSSPPGGYQLIVKPPQSLGLNLLVTQNSAGGAQQRTSPSILAKSKPPGSLQNKPGPRSISRVVNAPTSATTSVASPFRPGITVKSLMVPKTPTPAGSINQKLTINKTKLQPSAVSTPMNSSGPKPILTSTPKIRKSSTLVDLTNDEGKQLESDSREMVFNKVSGKTFPSLVVVARPNLLVKDIPQTLVAQERKNLDGDVKNVLMYPPPRFCEWLIQQGLISSEQHCAVHVHPDMSPVKLKLGMYSDASKFPFSGGYVWISDCCPAKFVSVFTDSLFENSSTPTVTLKLIYHWACQTSVSNVVQWVKVDNLYVKNFYTNMRAVCTSAIHEKLSKMGGARKRIEVGVISLGTTSADGHMRQVKVEVLGVLDPETKQIFLRAVEPTQDSEKNYKRRFSKILEHLETWVHKQSTILTDFTVDKGTLTSMGFPFVYQVSINDSANATNKYSNYNIMEYLRRIVPRMFQNTLSLLSRNIIQQFLDELVWREMYGQTSARAYKSIVQHIAEQTKLKIGGETILSRLSKIAMNPFKDWSYSAQQSNATPAPVSPSNPQIKLLVSENRPPPITGIDALPASITQVEHTEPVTKKNDSGIKRKRPTNGLGPASKKVNSDTSNKTTPAVPATPAAPAKPAIPAKPAPIEPIDSYYYGTYESNMEIINAQEKVELNMKCPICQTVFQNNLKLMMHLIMHAINTDIISLESSRVDPLCKYCLKPFSSGIEVFNHVEASHKKVGNELRCLICSETFKDRTSLILHMHRLHCELELPYECGICFYRASEHKKVIDHFYDVHKGTGKVQCPLCLKIIAFKTNDHPISKNMYFVLNHIQKHYRKSIARKCDKCELQFVHKGILKEHKEKDHASYVGIPNVERYSATIDSVMMPPPAANSNVVSKVTKQNIFEGTGFKTFYATQFDSLSLRDDIPEEATCCECEGFVTSENHFSGILSCIMCSYSTCCSKAMHEHSTVFHTNKQEFNMGTPIILPDYMFCVCGFKSKSGNRLAKHLADCKRKSAYPSAEKAAQNTVQSQSASFPPLVTLDDANNDSDPSDQWLRAFVTPNDNAEKTPPPSSKNNVAEAPSMLNMLGLVRKDPSDDTSSKASDDKLDSPVEPAENCLSINSDSQSNLSSKMDEDADEKPSEDVDMNSSKEVNSKPSEAVDDEASDVEMLEVVTVESSKVVDTESSKIVHAESLKVVDVEPSETVDVEPSETVDVEPSATVDVEPSATVDVEPTEVVDVDSSEEPDDAPPQESNGRLEEEAYEKPSEETKGESTVEADKQSEESKEPSEPLEKVDEKSTTNSEKSNDIGRIRVKTCLLQSDVQEKKNEEFVSVDETNAAVESISDQLS